MIDHIFNLFGGKKNPRNPENSGELVEFIPSFEDIEDFKKEHNLNVSCQDGKQADQIP